MSMILAVQKFLAEFGFEITRHFIGVYFEIWISNSHICYISVEILPANWEPTSPNYQLTLLVVMSHIV